MKTYIQTARETVSLYNLMGEKSNVELQEALAVQIGTTASPELCGRLTSRGVRDLVDMSIEELELEGLSHLKAVQLQSAFIIAKKLVSVGKSKPRYTIRSPEDASSYLMDQMSGLNQEHFIVLMLNVKNEIIGKKTIFIGGLNSSIVHPREVFKEAIKLSSASIIVAHNHPSGNPSPSPEDIEVNRRLVEAGSIMGIEVLDHVIIGDQKFISLKEKGYM